MNFMDWLADNMDVPSRVQRCAKMLIADANNGCGSLRYDAISWRAHFKEKHPDNANQLIDMLLIAYSEYILTIKAK